MHCPQWIMILSMGAVLALFPDASGLAQDPAAPPAGGVPDSQALPAAPGKPGKKRYSHANDFLIRGTVFTDKAYTFPGVLLRVRRAGEKKFRWESYTDTRGEFAVRVPQGSDYEMVVSAKGFAEQTRTVDTKTGANEESMVFRMQPTGVGKG